MHLVFNLQVTKAVRLIEQKLGSMRVVIFILKLF